MVIIIARVGSGDDNFLICIFFLNSNDKRFLSLHSSMQSHLSLIYIF